MGFIWTRSGENELVTREDLTRAVSASLAWVVLLYNWVKAYIESFSSEEADTPEGVNINFLNDRKDT